MVNILIYLIVNKINGKMYVGQTRRRLKHRFNQHCSSKCCVKLSRAIKKYGRNNFSISVLCVEDTQKSADEKEIFYIKKFRVIEEGYNLMSGGSYGAHSLETRKKMSLSRIGVKRPGISVAMKGKKRSKEFCKKISLAKKGRPNGLLGKKRNFKCPLRRVPVYCVDKNGVERYFESVHDAEITGCHRNNIRKCILGNRSESGGFKWYSLFGVNKVFIVGNDTVPVECINELGVIKVFRSVIDAGNKMGVSVGNIYSCIYGGRMFAGGFQWRRLFMLQNLMDEGK